MIVHVGLEKARSLTFYTFTLGGFSSVLRVPGTFWGQGKKILYKYISFFCFRCLSKARKKKKG